MLVIVTSCDPTDADEDAAAFLNVMILVRITSMGVVKYPAKKPEMPPNKVEVMAGILISTGELATYLGSDVIWVWRLRVWNALKFS